MRRISFLLFFFLALPLMGQSNVSSNNVKVTDSTGAVQPAGDTSAHSIHTTLDNSSLTIAQVTAANLNATVVQAVGSNLHMVCDSGCGGAASFTDNSSFTAGTTPINNIGGLYNDSTASLFSGSAAGVRINSARQLLVNDTQEAVSLINSVAATGSIVGSAVSIGGGNSGGYLKVSGSGWSGSPANCFLSLSLSSAIVSAQIPDMVSSGAIAIKLPQALGSPSFSRYISIAELGTPLDASKISAGFICTAYPSAGTLTVYYVPVHASKAEVADSVGSPQFNTPTGAVRTSPDSVSMLNESFDSALDTTNIWATSTSGTGSVGTNSGILTVQSSTTASSWAKAVTIPTFAPDTGWTEYTFKAISTNDTGNVPLTNATRFWGIGNPASVPTTSAVMTDGIGFELVDSKLYAVTYRNGGRWQLRDLSLTSQPFLNTSLHTFYIFAKSETYALYIDTLSMPVAVASFGPPNYDSVYIPDKEILPVALVAVSGVTPPGAAPQIAIKGITVGQTSHSGASIVDGTYPWREANVSSAGGLRTEKNDGQKLSYRASAAFTAVAGDIAVMPGSASKTIRVTAVEVSCSTSGTAANATLQLIKRSTADSAGTPAAMTAVPLDANDTAASAAPQNYTAAPTLGSSVGAIASQRVLNGATTVTPAPYRWAFGDLPGTRTVVLRGTAQQLAINLSAAVATETCGVAFEWTEE